MTFYVCSKCGYKHTYKPLNCVKCNDTVFNLLITSDLINPITTTNDAEVKLFRDNKTRPIEIPLSDDKTKELDRRAKIISGQAKTIQKLMKQQKNIEKFKSQYHELCEMQDELIKRLETENKDLRDNYEQYKAVAEPEIKTLKQNFEDVEIVNKSLEEKLKLFTVYQEQNKLLSDKNLELDDKITELECKVDNVKKIIERLIPYAFDLSEQLYDEELEIYREVEKFLRGE